MKPSLLTLMFLISFASVGAVLYTPALPAIAAHFGVSIGAAQNTVTYYLVGYALGQLPYGPLLNYFGRKPTIYFGCSLAIAGSVLCILAEATTLFWLLNLGRLVMALGMAVGLVSTFTLIADSMDRKQAHRAISYATLAFAIMPGVAIVIGGFLTEYVGWVSCFYFLAAYCLWVLFLATRLPKTGPKPFSHSMHPMKIFRGYWAQATTSSVLLGGIIMGASTAVVYVFSAKAPFIGIELIGLNPDDYGLWMLIPTSGAICGGLLSAYLSARYPPRPLVWTGVAIMGVCVAVPLIAFAFGKVNALTLFLPMAFVYSGLTVGYAAISSSITAEATDKSNASAFMAFLNMGIAAVGVLIVGVIGTKSALFLPAIQFVMVGVMLVTAIIYVWTHRSLHKNAQS